ncbi:hypothetical protein POM88_000807 [Heracleum sosnowskyi]|uniref:Uncharacterized protein n=1 Tax=Heracleum sosnowskyi TaxID=360622 RepID=A0AAD8JEY5_9APIA|nr:hypothetical protein POM88_000807 [Heracleum sosnowskyi]
MSNDRASLSISRISALKVSHRFQFTNFNHLRCSLLRPVVKLYKLATGFLQLKDPHQSIPMEKTSAAGITSKLWQNLYIDKSQKHETDPTMKFIKELQSDLELVYVGQMCLSWEILHWQYEMALDLWESDPLPIIREDISNDNKKERMIKRDEYSITIDMLVEIVEESIRIYWRFIRADKNCSSALLKSRKGQIELQDPADSQTLKEVQKDLKRSALIFDHHAL